MDVFSEGGEAIDMARLTPGATYSITVCPATKVISLGSMSSNRSRYTLLDIFSIAARRLLNFCGLGSDIFLYIEGGHTAHTSRHGGLAVLEIHTIPCGKYSGNIRCRMVITGISQSMNTHISFWIKRQHIL